MKRFLAVLTCLCCGSAALADEVTWTGGASGIWEVGDNWSTGSMPGAYDTVVLKAENGTKNTIGFNPNPWTVTGKSFGSIRVEGGDWLITATNVGAAIQRQINHTIGGDGTSGLATIDIAAGATLTCSNNIVPRAVKVTSLKITGEGLFDEHASVGTTDKLFARIDYRGPSHGYLAQSNLGTTNFTLGAGISLTISDGTGQYRVKGAPEVCLEPGSFLRLYTEQFDGISGSGTVSGNPAGVLTLDLQKYGPYRYDGQFGLDRSSQNAQYVAFGAQGAASDEEYQFIVSSPDAFANSPTVTFATGGVHPLKFAPGVGSVSFYHLGGKEGAPLCLEDTDGNPVTIYVNRHCTTASNYQNFEHLRFTGSGSFFSGSRTGWNPSGEGWGIWGRPYTNDVFKGLTGTLGVYNVYGSLYAGDGTAAHDLDMSTLSRVEVRSSGTSVGNRFLCQNATPTNHSWQLDVASGCTATFNASVGLNGPVTGKGTVTLSGGGELTRLVGDPSAGGMAVAAAKDLLLSAAGGAAVFNAVQATANDMSVTFTNGVFRRTYAANGNDSKYFNTYVPNGLNLYGGGSVTRRFVVARDATVWVAGTGYGDRHPSYLEVCGTLVQRLNESFGTTVTGHILLLNGGTYSVAEAGGSYDQGTLPSSAENWIFRIGAGGGTYDHDHVNKFSIDEGRARVTFNATFEDDPNAAKPGAFHFRTPVLLNLSAPVMLTGPVHWDEGMIRFTDNATNRTALAAGSALGCGDIHLGQAVIDFGFYSADRTPKIGALAGQTVYYDTGATVVGRRQGSAAQTVTFGNGTGAPFVRGQKGAALFLVDYSRNVPFDGNGAKFFAADGCTVACDEGTGILSDPVFGHTILRYEPDGRGDFGAYTFLTYDETKGFVETSNYVTNDLAKGGVVTLDTTNSSLSADASVAALRLDAVQLALKSGVTLRVGPDDAAKTAKMIFNNMYESSWSGQRCGIVYGQGTLDFGKSEAVLVSEILDRGAVAACGIGCRITGSGGLSIASAPMSTLNGFSISGVNENTGDIRVSGTDLRVNGTQALGSARVIVNGSRFGGGGVRFFVGGTFANEFFVSGFGPRRGENHVPDYGALVFSSGANVTLTGPIHIDRKVRVSNTSATVTGGGINDRPGHGTIAGVISGGMLDVSGPANGSYPTNRLDLCGANTYTGGTFVAFHNVWVSGPGTLGTGPVTLANGAFVTFDYASARTVPNDWNGFGTVRVVGSGEVAFTGAVEPSAACSIKLDLAGSSPKLKGLPAFAAITNTATKAARLTLTGDATLGASQGFGGTNMRLVVDGATLDLAGRAIDFAWVRCKNGGKIVNGTYAETSPRRGTMVFLK